MGKIPVILAGLVLILCFGCLQKEIAEEQPAPLESTATSEQWEEPNTYVAVAEVFRDTGFSQHDQETCMGNYSYECPEGSLNCKGHSPKVRWMIESWPSNIDWEAETGAVLTVSGKKFYFNPDFYGDSIYINDTAYYVRFECQDKGISYFITEEDPPNKEEMDEMNRVFMEAFADMCSAEENLTLPEVYAETVDIFKNSLPNTPEQCTGEYAPVCNEVVSGCEFDSPGHNYVWWFVHEKNTINVTDLEAQTSDVSGHKFYYYNDTSDDVVIGYWAVTECRDKAVSYLIWGRNLTLMVEISQEYMEGLAKVC